jgi:histidinol-phosphate aminotransferase
MKIEDVLKLVRPHLLNLKPYSSARDEFDQSNVDKDSYVYLDANENPFNTGYNRYPDPYQRELKNKIASIKNIPVDQIFLGNGSDEAIDLIIRLFCNESDNILIPTPTYGMYKVSAEINNVNIKTCLLNENFALTNNFSWDNNTKVIFLCSPNNPSGNLLDIQPILDRFKGIVVVDEAYIDFAKTESQAKQLNKFPNLVVLQTLSKAWGLAGLRLGMAFAHPIIISLLNKIKPPYNISSATQELAMRALENTKEKDERVKSILNEKDRVEKLLRNLKSVKKVFPSEANFLLVKIDNASHVYSSLIKDRIVVRDRSQVQLCEDCLRITIGTREENEKLLEALRQHS